MRIAPIKNNFYNNVNFTSKVVEVGRGNVSPELKDAVDQFEETNGANAKKLGSGLSAFAYRIKGTDCVLKASKPGKARVINGDFSKEAKSLEMIPENFMNAQRLIGNVRTEDNNWYLLSTFVGGDVPNGKTVKWDRESLKSLMDGLAELDINHVYHGDVSKSNCLITKDKQVNFLDFQYADKFDFYGDEAHRRNADRYKVPYFIAPSNLQMFEESNFATYLTEIDEDEARSLFKTYLEEKSNYHEKRANAFQNQNARYEIVDYDRLMSRYLKNPTEEMITLQAQKLQILLTHRSLLSSIDGYDNIMSAIPHYLHMIEKSNEMASTASYLASIETDPDLKRLYEYHKEDAIFWRAVMKNEVDGRYGKSSAFDWILRNAKMSPNNDWDNIVPTFIKTSEQKHHIIPDVQNIIVGGSEHFGFEEEKKDDLTSWMEGNLSKLRKTQSFYIHKNSPSYETIKSHHKSKERILKDLKSAHELYLEGKQYDSLFYSMRSLYRSAVARNNAYGLVNDRNLSWDEKARMRSEARFFEEYVEDLANMNGHIYGRLYAKASNPNM